MQKKKVLHVSINGLGNGGIQNVIMGIVRNLSKDIDFDILLFTDDIRHYDNEFLEYGKIFRISPYSGASKIIKMLDSAFRPLKIFIGTYRILKKNKKYDAIHCHNDLMSGICNLAAFFARVNIRITHSHTSVNKLNDNNLLKYLYKLILSKLMNLFSNVKIGCTEESFVSIFGSKYLTKKSSHILYNSIDLKRFSKKDQITKVKDRVKIVNVGSFSKNKNQIFLIGILPYILKEIPNTVLQLIGFNDKYKRILEDSIDSLNLNSHVEFLPSDSDISKILETADVFIFPSLHEGFGIALLEAQAMEVPCLVSDTVPKVVDVGLCEFASLSESKEVWAEKAVDIIKERHTLKLNRGKLEKFNLKKYVKKMSGIYEAKI